MHSFEWRECLKVAFVGCSAISPSHHFMHSWPRGGVHYVMKHFFLGSRAFLPGMGFRCVGGPRVSSHWYTMGSPGLVFEMRPFLIILASSILAYNQTSVSDGGRIVSIDNHSLDRCSLTFATPDCCHRLFWMPNLALLWQIFSGTGFPNQFFNDSWVVGFLEDRPW